ncbi:hypothetical protein [Adhaeribacter rhizoryzae]|uniref:Uncharacterized protein n=1 Tax=Adhaeribacter rhizoryzae TaxID=2607907 RepID=A0A5M6D3E7_9BACT|nr:hypothetical protein [Adhaeribacter rhizoryzae]KAA5542027.1 hypothetical protein F0145_19765 [Adhaeribacter rhizoryzae]
MKAMQKFIHLSLVAAILLASMGFRVTIAHCSGEEGGSISLFADPSCCCGKAAKSPRKSCQDMTCVMQRGVASPINFNSATQQAAKFAKEPVTYPSFTASIRPAILETLPHFTLPPPMSGRSIGILHQTFII